MVLHDDEEQSNTTRISLLEQLGQSSRLLTLMIEKSFPNQNDQLDMVTSPSPPTTPFSPMIDFQNIQGLILDGILALRLRLLTSIMINNEQRIPYLDDFQEELDCYRQLNQLMKLPKQRVCELRDLLFISNLIFFSA